jgi:AICAR transformylase/IMP cyclohydrolase PurH
MMVIYMDLEPIWQQFIKKLTLNKDIDSAYWRKISGIPFLYIIIAPELSQLTLETIIKKCSVAVIKGNRLHSETIFVRQDGVLLVYRHRFYVPQEKMFCCGNLCVDCTRLKR